MKIDLYQVDAFTDKQFGGNPAAVCPLEDWLQDDLLQNIAAENNLSETAFFVKKKGQYSLRWFTPLTEVNLCGHATLAAAYVIFNFIDTGAEKIEFSSLSGLLTVRNRGNLLELNFPVSEMVKIDVDNALTLALRTKPVEVWQGEDLMAVFNSEETIRKMEPDFTRLKHINTRGIIVTAKGARSDFVSRFFGPAVGIDEDPVTGSAHTMLTPYWSKRLGREELLAHQLSSRFGVVHCKLLGDRVLLSGSAVMFLKGKIQI
jgi:PhzF family phenazine biosynthesis protein